MKGIILAGGAGSRLLPMTKAISKQLLPVYDKPMIYYPLSTLMCMGIRSILIISTPRDVPYIKQLLGDGSELGISLSYKEQANPDGIAHAFIIGEEFIAKEPVCLILGDNIFYGRDLSSYLRATRQKAQESGGAHIFAYHVRDPERYGVVEYDGRKRVIGIEEKPKQPKSNWAITGLYCYDGNVANLAKTLTLSERGELEITDLNNLYLARQELHVEFLGRGMAWLDAGTPESFLKASVFIQAIEERQGLKIGCIEEVAYQNGFVDAEQLLKIADCFGKNDYGAYLRTVLEEDDVSMWRKSS